MENKKYYAYYLPEEGISGVVNDWEKCKKIVSGVQNAKYKGFKTKEEASKWLEMGADYNIKRENTPGIYFDAGTGRGYGVEISITDEKGHNIIHKALPKNQINKFGKHLILDDVSNNYGELLACFFALKIAQEEKIKNIFGDSKLILDYWSKGFAKEKELSKQTVDLIAKVKKLRKDFEFNGGKINFISGDDNPADLGFHK